MTSTNYLVAVDVPEEPGVGSVALDWEGVAWQKLEDGREDGRDWAAVRTITRPVRPGLLAINMPELERASWSELVVRGTMRVVWDPDAEPEQGDTDTEGPVDGAAEAAAAFEGDSEDPRADLARALDASMRELERASAAHRRLASLWAYGGRLKSGAIYFRPVTPPEPAPPTVEPWLAGRLVTHDAAKAAIDFDRWGTTPDQARATGHPDPSLSITWLPNGRTRVDGVLPAGMDLAGVLGGGLVP